MFYFKTDTYTYIYSFRAAALESNEVFVQVYVRIQCLLNYDGYLRNHIN